jgi:hypothetical protein
MVVALVTLALLGACSRAPHGSGTTASATRTATASSAAFQLVLDAGLLTAGNCSAPAPTTEPRQLGRYFTIRPVSNWTDTGDYQHTETLFLELTAPDAYGFAPTRIEFQGGAVGPVHTIFGPGATAHSIAQQRADSIAQETSPSAVAGTVRDCRVGGEAAAAYGFSNGTISGFYIYVVHSDGLMEVVLFGSDGLGDQAIQDCLAILSSLVWTF